MNKVVIAVMTAISVIAASPTFASPAEEAAEDYDGWRAARQSEAAQQIQTRDGHVIHRGFKNTR